MAYSKQTWDTTSYVNPTRMNHIEDGIEEADSKTADDIPYSSGVSVKDKIDEVEGDIPEIADNLTTNDSTKALSAKQGKVLNDKVDGKVGNWTLFEVTTTGNVTLPNNYTEFMFEVQTSSGIYSIIIPKIVFDRRVVGSSWYMQGWLYNSSIYAYSFITKQDTNSFKVTIFQNGSPATIVERVLYYR